MASPILYLKAIQFAKNNWKSILVVVIAVIMFLLMLPAIFLAMFTPSADENLLNEYQSVAQAASLDWADLVTYDVVINDNDLSDVKPEDTAYSFLLVEYKKYKPIHDDEGNIVRWELIDSGSISGKRQIEYFLQKEGYRPRSIQKSIDYLESLSAAEEFDINIIRLDLQDMIRPLSEDKIEWANSIISSNVLYEMFNYMPDLPDFIPVPDNSFFAWPTPGLTSVTSEYGWRIHPTTKKRSFHSGIDIAGAGAYGSPIIAVATGEVYQVNISNGAFGNNVRIKHVDSEGNEWQTRYCHMSTIKVKENQTVKKGDVIGAVGNTGISTGPHLHFELKFEGRLVDPYPYIE